MSDFSLEILSQKAQNLIEEVNKKVIEREELIRIMTLAIFSKSHIFLIGPPGVGKTYVINIMLSAIKDAKYFEYLIMNHTKPEELFGTTIVSDDGELIYNYENSVLDSHFVMLDEMFKARSEILNSLLGVTSNDRTFFMRGRGAVKVPLITMFGASNEFPTDDALEPFDDRLLLRFNVERIKDAENYKRLISGDFDKTKTINTSLTLEEIEYVFLKSKEVTIPKIVVELYSLLKQKIVQNRIVVSDRKMYTAMEYILKTSATLNQRDYVDYSDLFLILHIAWRDYVDQEKIKVIIFDLFYTNRVENTSTISTIKNDMQKISNYYNQNVKEFIYKRVYVNAQNFESVFSQYFPYIKDIEAGINVIDDAVTSLENKYNLVLEIEKQVEKNMFLIDYKQNSFDAEVLKSLRDIKKEFSEYKYAISTFILHCPDAFGYLNFDPIKSLD